MGIEIIPLRQATDFLLRLRRPSLDQMIGDLLELRKSTVSARILNELDPEQMAQIVGECSGPRMEENGWKLFGAALEAIHKIAPIFFESIEADYQTSDFAELVPSIDYGFPMGWDDWNAVRDNPQDYSESYAIYVFFTALRLGDEIALQNWAEHCGWNITVPKFGTMGEFVWEKIEKKLKRNHLEYFINAIRACYYETDNLYFDFNPYDDGVIYDNLPPFTIEGVRTLEKEWTEAQPILADLNRAVQEFAENPGIVRTLLRIFLTSIKKKLVVRVSTLNELFIEGENRETDPFGILDWEE